MLVLTMLVAVACSLALAHAAFALLKGVPDRTPRVEGIVYDTVRVGNTIYLGGQFQRVGGVTRYNLAAVDATTGVLRPWNPGANGTVLSLAASPNGSRVYAGGYFTGVDGSPHARVAAIDAATGAADNSWNPAVSAPVRAIAVQGSNVFLGGAFRTVNGQPRRGLALVAAGTGALNPRWRPAVGGFVRDLQVSGPRLYVAGKFRTVSGRPRSNLAALSARNGALLKWSPDPRRPLFDVLVSGRRVYTAQGGRGGAVATYDARNGAAVWVRNAGGDAQTLALMDKRLFVGGHFNVIGGLQRPKMAAIFPASGKLDSRWAPRVNKGIWSLTADPTRGKLYVGGGFSRVSGRVQPGLARFSRVQ